MNGHLVSLDTRTEMMFIHNLLSQSLLLGNEELRDVYIGKYLHFSFWSSSPMKTNSFRCLKLHE